MCQLPYTRTTKSLNDHRQDHNFLQHSKHNILPIQHLFLMNGITLQLEDDWQQHNLSHTNPFSLQNHFENLLSNDTKKLCFQKDTSYPSLYFYRKDYIHT